ncbi:hypothetical protein GCM10010191_38960 [Actinomadura vinacea]|uniref:Uncharacterized protein n=1 Tax=Actinomadura vinacea TaxID=115336 RepID=A0ABP5WA72_9ACTN
MNTIEFSLVPYTCDWADDPVHVLNVLVDGTELIELVRQAELPFALQEQQERAEDFAPDPAPLLAGSYMRLGASYGWPGRHLLGDPYDVPWFYRDDGETMMLTCTCGIDECWALMARIEVEETTVRWSSFRNTHRDWDLSSLGPFTFSRPQYESALKHSAGER